MSRDKHGHERLGMHCFGLGGQQLPQHVLQNAAVGVVQRFLRSVDAHQSLEFCGFAVFGRFDRDLPAGAKFSTSSRMPAISNTSSPVSLSDSAVWPDKNCRGRIPMPTRFER